MSRKASRRNLSRQLPSTLTIDIVVPFKLSRRQVKFSDFGANPESSSNVTSMVNTIESASLASPLSTAVLPMKSHKTAFPVALFCDEMETRVQTAAAAAIFVPPHPIHAPAFEDISNVLLTYHWIRNKKKKKKKELL